MLEALIGILVFSFGIASLVGLQAKSMKHLSDAHYRGEAAFLAHSIVARMWTDDPATLATRYQSGGAGYAAFREMVKALPGGADASNAPDIRIEPGPSAGSSLVMVRVFWVLPGETAANRHNYGTTAVVGRNP